MGKILRVKGRGNSVVFTAHCSDSNNEKPVMQVTNDGFKDQGNGDYTVLFTTKDCGDVDVPDGSILEISLLDETNNVLGTATLTITATSVLSDATGDTIITDYLSGVSATPTDFASGVYITFPKQLWANDEGYRGLNAIDLTIQTTITTPCGTSEPSVAVLPKRAYGLADNHTGNLAGLTKGFDYPPLPPTYGIGGVSAVSANDAAGYDLILDNSTAGGVTVGNFRNDTDYQAQGGAIQNNGTMVNIRAMINELHSHLNLQFGSMGALGALLPPSYTWYQNVFKSVAFDATLPKPNLIVFNRVVGGVVQTDTLDFTLTYPEELEY